MAGVPGLGWRGLPGRQNAPDHDPVQAVFALLEGLVVFLGAQRKDRQMTVFAEILGSDLNRQVADRLSKSQDVQLQGTGTKLTKDLSTVEEAVYQVRNQSGQDPLNFPIKINNRLASLLGVVSRADAKPIASAYPIFNDLKGELKVQTDRLQEILTKQLPAFNAEARRLGLEPITVGKPVVF